MLKFKGGSVDIHVPDIDFCANRVTAFPLLRGDGLEKEERQKRRRELASFSVGG